MRIDILTEIFLPDTNGGALRVFHLAKNCAKQAEIRVITKSALLDSKKSVRAFETRDGFRVYRERTAPNRLSRLLNQFLHLELSTLFTYYSSLRKSYRKVRPDVLYVRQSFALQLVALMLRGEFGIPVFFEFHRFNSKSDFNLRRIGRLQFSFYYLLEKSILRRADGVIAISDVNKDELAAEGITGGKIVVVPNGVDNSIFYPGHPTPSGNKRPLLLYFGFMRANEGVDILMRAMPILIKKIPGVKLVITGAGNVTEANRRLAASLRVQAHIDFRGEVSLNELLQWLSAADLFVYPRRGIPYHLNFLGLKVLEALSTGTPVVTADIGILADFIREHDCGLLFRPDDPQSLADSIYRALLDKRLLARLSKNAVACTRHMDWRDSAGKLLEACRRFA